MRTKWNRRTSTLLGVLAATLAGVAPCSGGVITVTNPSFETPATTTTAVPAGWVSANAASYNPYEFKGGDVFYAGANPSTDPANGGAGYPGIDGENLGYVFQAGPGSGFSQQLAATFQAATSYTLTVTELRRNGTGGAPTLGSEIELLAGSTVIASSIDAGGPAPGAFTDQVAFLPDSDAFAGLVGQQLSIALLTTDAFTVPNQSTDWDNVRMTDAAAPEPASVFLLVTGALAVVLLHRRTKANC